MSKLGGLSRSNRSMANLGADSRSMVENSALIPEGKLLSINIMKNRSGSSSINDREAIIGLLKNHQQVKVNEANE